MIFPPSATVGSAISDRGVTYIFAADGRWHVTSVASGTIAVAGSSSDALFQAWLAMPGNAGKSYAQFTTALLANLIDGGNA